VKLTSGVIVVSGTPGVGKTFVAKELARKLNAIYLNLSNVVFEKKLYSEYDEIRETYVVDEVKLKDYVRNIVKETNQLVVIDSHYGEIVDDDLIIKIFILRLDPRKLLKRLENRSWPLLKIKENVEAELLGICTANALAEHPVDKVCEIDVTDKVVDAVLKEILDILSGRVECKVYINWLLDDSVVSEVLSFLTSK